MTTHETAVKIIGDLLQKRKIAGRYVAEEIAAELLQKRIAFQRLHASGEFLKRFHAHTRYLAGEIGQTYEELKAEAVRHAMAVEMWPIKEIPWPVKYTDANGTEHEIITDVIIPQSSTLANSRQLMTAYDYILDMADESGVKLPENV